MIEVSGMDKFAICWCWIYQKHIHRFHHLKLVWVIMNVLFVRFTIYTLLEDICSSFVSINIIQQTSNILVEFSASDRYLWVLSNESSLLPVLCIFIVKNVPICYICRNLLASPMLLPHECHHYGWLTIAPVDPPSFLLISLQHNQGMRGILLEAPMHLYKRPCPSVCPSYFC